MSLLTVFNFAEGNPPTPIVVVKADDLVYRADGTIFGSGWNRFLEIAETEEIKVSIGIICNSLDSGKTEYFEKIQALHASGQVEFWNHGYTHGRDPETGESEFRGPSLEAQLDTISRSQALALEKLGFPFTTFGSPYNANDANTALALREHPEISSWLYGIANADLLPGQVVLGRSVNLEQPVHHPNFEGFQRDFLKNPDRPYYVLQGHPGGWDEARFEEFQKVVGFLKERGAEFITPSELSGRLLKAIVIGLLSFLE